MPAASQYRLAIELALACGDNRRMTFTPPGNITASVLGPLVSAAVADIPATPSWFGPDGNKLVTAEWRKYNVDTPATRNAADWIFHTPPQPSHHLRNYPTIQPHRAALAKHFDDLLLAGLTEQFDPAVHLSEQEFAEVVNPLHVVSKGDGDIRPIIDPTASGVNGCMEHLPCPLPTLDTILHNLPPNGFLGKRDLASGFHHVKLRPSARRFVAFRHPTTNALQRFVVLPFGASQSPPIFVELTSAACSIFQSECDLRGLHVRIFVYVDDFMVLGDTHEDVAGAFAVLDEVGGALGLQWKIAKDRGRDTPLQHLDFLGMRFDTVAMEMRIAPEKRDRYAADVEALLQASTKGAVSRTALQSTVGKLTFITRACRWGTAFLQSLYDSLFDASATPPATIHLSSAAREDLDFWRSVLRSDRSLWDGIKRCIVSDINLVRGEFLGADGAVVFTDASGKGFGAAWDEAEVQGPWGSEDRDLHIAWLELKAVLRALQSWAPHLAGRRVLIRCDNTQAVAAINYGSTRVPDGRPIARHIAELAVRNDFEVRAEHIRGSENARADRLSRHLQRAEGQNLQLKAAVFDDLCQAAGWAPSVDCCCDARGLNAQRGCRQFFSAAQSVLGQEAVLAGKRLWAFPPHDLVGDVLGVIGQAWAMDRSTRALVVVPSWEDRAWFRHWVRRRGSPYRVLRVLRAGRTLCLWPWGREAAPAVYDFLVLHL